MFVGKARNLACRHLTTLQRLVRGKHSSLLKKTNNKGPRPEMIAREKHSSLFCLFVSDEEKSYKTFCP
jgi:hypothetical protein